MDIDFILNGKKPKKRKQSKDPLLDLFSSKPKKSQGGLMDLFVGQGHPRPGDRITKSQRRVLKNKRSMFGDWDGDGVINGLDCSPRNRNKHMVKRTFYHVTPEKNVASINKHGLKTPRLLERNPYEIYLATSKTHAEKYLKEGVRYDKDDNLQNQKRVMYQVELDDEDKFSDNPEIDKIRKSNLKESMSSGREYIYYKNIPPDKLKIIKKSHRKVFHATNPASYPGIRKKGVLPHKATTRNPDQQDDYFKYRDYSYWSTDRKAAENYGPITLSTDITDDEYKEGERLSKERSSYPELRVKGEVLVKGVVSPQRIKVEKNPFSEEELK